MEFNRVTLDFVNRSCSISLSGIDHLFSSADNFKTLTGYPFQDTHLMFYEPERAIYVVERSGPEVISGTDLPEIQWVNDNKDIIIQAAHNDGYGALAPLPSLSDSRTNKLYETDWMVVRHKDQLDLGIITTLTNDQYQKLLAYRQQLRDITKKYTSLDDVVWPLLDI